MTEKRPKEKHGLWKAREYQAWSDMKRRCNNPKNKFYKDYGARGICVCSRWQDSFKNFIADMGMKPTPEYSIDRRDNDKGYSPENCYWATKFEQQNNTRLSKSRAVFWEGKITTLGELSARYGIPRNVIGGRIDLGWPMEEVISRPVKLSVRSTKPSIRPCEECKNYFKGRKKQRFCSYSCSNKVINRNRFSSKVPNCSGKWGRV